ncbi:MULTISPECIES: glycosyltransferase [unclassified Variovorax]|uniref:glycosyltransferase n=1 Tax=unclassified Variovorax TaxID=663243 RepID=UPI0025773F6C|nr:MULTISPECIES: glycosyltransferase [unclassified Variovorax]MDM0090582.1 hypothetical protein [Variovorax sp. J22G40]MDM0147753.1 hypothetical protein [Variovorax sp. J2P1-31]
MRTDRPLAIVVIAYNRVASLQRLISSLLKAEYKVGNVPLIISIDKSGDDAVERCAKDVVWPYGEKSIICHQERLGLKKHVLACGDLTKQYENICVLEDDLYVSPYFYEYGLQMLDVYGGERKIAGISLYSHQWNPYVDRPFSAIDDGCDIFALQIASSWGQIWSRGSWREFVDWLDGVDESELHSDSFPSEVANWSAKSWLKYHNKYLVETGKYFLYPKVSLTTNFSDVGEHAFGSSAYQVPLLMGEIRDYRRSEKFEDISRYDAFFENEALPRFLGLPSEMVDVSLYGNKIPTKKYLLTDESHPYAVVKSFSRNFRPMDLNVILGIAGNDIFLYDRSRVGEFRKMENRLMARKYLYEVRSSAKYLMLISALSLYIAAIRRKIFKK